MKYLICVLIYIISSVNCVGAFTCLPHEGNFGTLAENGFDLPSEITFNTDKLISFSKKNNVRTAFTYNVRKYVTDSGVNCHAAIYTDGVVLTALDGTEEGKQIIFANDTVTAISYDFEIRKDHFIHKYTWGKVHSYVDKQFIYYND